MTTRQTIIHLEPTDLWAVILQRDADEYSFADDLGYISEFCYWESGIGRKSIKLPAEGSWTICGEITFENGEVKVGFDPRPYLESPDYKILGNVMYRNYLGEGFTSSRNDSLISLLTKHELGWVNSFGEHYPSRLAESDGTLQTLEWQRIKWNTAEASKLSAEEKILIIRKNKRDDTK